MQCNAMESLSTKLETAWQLDCPSFNALKLNLCLNKSLRVYFAETNVVAALISRQYLLDRIRM